MQTAAVMGHDPMILSWIVPEIEDTYLILG
jgi:hypothetical protein